MSMLINYDKITGEVTLQHYQPETIPQVELQTLIADGAFYVDAIPEPVSQDGKYPALYVNLTDNTLYYQFKDLPLTPEDKIAKLAAELESANQSIAELTILMSTLMV